MEILIASLYLRFITIIVLFRLQRKKTILYGNIKFLETLMQNFLKLQSSNDQSDIPII